ncbi:MAG: hypothetical protein AAGD38_09230 [Acidobacteriota bacterium]
MKISLLTHRIHRRLGWVTDDESTACLVVALEAAGIDVAVHEVANRRDVESLITSAGPNTLFWGNVYDLPSGNGAPPFWLADVFERAGVPYVGSDSVTLRTLIDKDVCQARLAAAGLPVPRYVTLAREPLACEPLAREPLARASELIEAAELTWPVFVKPAATAGSAGIAPESVQHTVAGAVSQSMRVLERFGGRVLVEEFLPGPELTLGVIRDREGGVVVATRVDLHMEGGFLTEQNRRGDFARGATTMTRLDAVPYTDLALEVCDTLDIRDVTRMDGRFDAAGTLKIFDVNGMPGLSPIHSCSVQQIYAVFPEVDRAELHRRFVVSIVASAAERYGLDVPEQVREQRLQDLPRSQIIADP